MFLALAVVAPVGALARRAALPLSGAVRWAVAAGVASTSVRSGLKLIQERRRASGEVRGFAVYDMLQTGGAFALGAALAAAGLGGAAPLIGAGVVSALLLAVALPRELRTVRGAGFDRERLKAAAAYGLPLSLSLVMTLALVTTDRFVPGRLPATRPRWAPTTPATASRAARWTCCSPGSAWRGARPPSPRWSGAGSPP